MASEPLWTSGTPLGNYKISTVWINRKFFDKGSQRTLYMFVLLSLRNNIKNFYSYFEANFNIILPSALNYYRWFYHFRLSDPTLLRVHLPLYALRTWRHFNTPIRSETRQNASGDVVPSATNPLCFKVCLLAHVTCYHQLKFYASMNVKYGSPWYTWRNFNVEWKIPFTIICCLSACCKNET